MFNSNCDYLSSFLFDFEKYCNLEIWVRVTQGSRSSKLLPFDRLLILVSYALHCFEIVTLERKVP